MGDKTYKMKDSELREGTFKPRLWRNGGRPISKEGLNNAIAEADRVAALNEDDFFKEFEE